MAVVIHHGPAGSYKTSSAVWFYLLPALRDGRAVVTNVEGMYPLNEIEDLIGEKFPDSARLWRISSQIPENRKLWRSWFNWMPIGALILLDEAQDIYIKDPKVWKPADLKHVPADAYSDYLPPDLLEYFHDVHRKFKPPMDSASVDDTGRAIVDANGLIIYPPEFTESYMRHRKFNWDVHLCTPDIRKIHSDIRGVAELAISYSSKDSFSLSKRNPRLYEHDPKQNGMPAKNEPTRRQKVPVDVHLLYRSTSTGQITKSGAASGPLSTAKGKFVFFVVIPLSLFSVIYNGYKVLHHADPAVVASSSSASSGASKGLPDANRQGINASGSSNGNKIPASRPSVGDTPDFIMPFDAERIYWVGRSCKVTSKNQNSLTMPCDIVFELILAGKRYQLHNDELAVMGYRVISGDYCNAKLIDSEGNKKMIYCKPEEIKEQEQQFRSPVNISAGLVAANDSGIKSDQQEQSQ